METANEVIKEKKPEKQLDPEVQLNQLRNEMKQKEKDLDQISKDLKNNKDDVAKLEAFVADRKKIVEQYSKKEMQIKKQANELKKYSDTKTEMIKPAVKDHIEEVDKIIEEVDGNIIKLKKDVEDKNNKLEAKKSEYNDAEKKSKEKKNIFDKLKSFQKTIEDDINRMVNLRGKIKKDEEDNRFFLMYFHIKELNVCLREITEHIINSSQLEKNLNKDWQEMYSAFENYRKKEIELEVAKKDYELAQEKLPKAEKNKEKVISEKLTKIND